MAKFGWKRDSISRVQKNLKDYQKRRKKHFEIAFAAWADDTVAEMQSEIMRVGALDQGILAAATTRTEPMWNGMKLRIVMFNPMEYATVIEFGRRPGSGKPPPLLPLVGWAIGNVTRDPELKSTTAGTSLCNLGLATSQKWTDKKTGEQKHATEFHNLVAWDSLADLLGKFVRKGSPIYVEGHLKTSLWDDATSGKKTYRTEIVVDDFVMLGQKQDADTAAEETAAEPDWQS